MFYRSEPASCLSRLRLGASYANGFATVLTEMKQTQSLSFGTISAELSPLAGRAVESLNLVLAVVLNDSNGASSSVDRSHGGTSNHILSPASATATEVRHDNLQSTPGAAPSKTFMSPLGMHRLGAAQAAPGQIQSRRTTSRKGQMSTTWQIGKRVLARSGSDKLCLQLPPCLHSVAALGVVGSEESEEVVTSHTSVSTINIKAIRIVCSDPASGCVAMNLRMESTEGGPRASIQSIVRKGSAAVSSDDVVSSFDSASTSSHDATASVESAKECLPPIVRRLRQHYDNGDGTSTGMLLPDGPDAWVAV